MTGAVLVIGYGNVLRSDDGVGWHVAELLARDPRMTGAVVLRRHQLTPELSLDCSRATLVVLVDAGHGPVAGSFAVERVEAIDDGSTTWSHHLGPETLLALSRELYGTAPEMLEVRVGIGSLETGEHLSPTVAAVVPVVAERIVTLATEHWASALTSVAAAVGGGVHA